ncbi:43610_t:CDS:1, partial [Gigaspora margarita]
FKQEGNQKILLIENELVKKETVNHFKVQFKKQGANIVELESEWKETYRPKENIKEEWFKQLNASVEMEEWYQMLRDLKSNKAPGNLNISYTMLKQASEKAYKILARLAKAL